ncbi:MAG: YraN family protein [Candidatus Abawacabacteria bacterium]|nr:YraN family protein [Candidatus Abawacabacteria bacterium]
MRELQITNYESCGEPAESIRIGDAGRKRELGMIAEEYAGHYLQACGYMVEHCNWRYKHHELDLVIRDAKQQLVFIEVKAAQAPFDPIQHFSDRKQRDFKAAIGDYLEQYQLWEETFSADLVTISLATDYSIYSLAHYDNVI